MGSLFLDPCTWEEKNLGPWVGLGQWWGSYVRVAPTPWSVFPSTSSGQKYMTAVVKLFGPLTRNYYVRAILHLL